MKGEREKEALEDDTQEEERKRGTDAVLRTRTQSSRGQLGLRHSCIKGKPTRVNLLRRKASKSYRVLS